MNGETNLDKILKSLNPEISVEEYIFCTYKDKFGKMIDLDPWAIIQEQEGTTYIIERRKAEKYKIEFESVFKRITIKIVTSLNAVGLTAVISKRLTNLEISANIVSGFYHDHIFVPTERAKEAKRAIEYSGDNSMDGMSKNSVNIERVYRMAFSRVYPLYIKKAEKKGRTKEEVDEIIFWLTGYDKIALQQQLESGSDFEKFFAQAPKLHSNVSKITGLICGYRVEDIEDPLVRKVRYLDKLIDELAKGKAMEKILRK